MGHRSDYTYACSIVADVNEYADNDWEETTRDERYWMQEARDLAIALAKSTGYIPVPEAR